MGWWTYAAALSEEISRVIVARDRMRHRVELSHILPEDQMKSVLSKTLEGEGWAETEPGIFETTGPGGETLTWNVEEGVVEASIEREEKVSTTVNASAGGKSQEDADQRVLKDLERQKAGANEAFEGTRGNMEQELGDELRESEEERKQQINEVIRKAYASAIKEKAAGMGSIVSVDEKNTSSTYDLTIRVAQ
jgi:hypothetical protein